MSFISTAISGRTSASRSRSSISRRVENSRLIRTSGSPSSSARPTRSRPARGWPLASDQDDLLLEERLGHDLGRLGRGVGDPQVERARRPGACSIARPLVFSIARPTPG